MSAVPSLKLVNAQMQVLRARLRSVDCVEILGRLGDIRAAGFVDQPAVLDLSAVPPDRLSEARWPEILEAFRAVGLNPIALTGVDASLQRQLTARSGLAPVDASSLELRRTAEAIASPAEPAWLPPLVVQRQVRSGQQVYARQRDLIVLASISPGAEVIADGNVTCYGTLRGRAVAGAAGRPDAFIHALDFRPELVAVAGVYMTFESGPPAMPAGRLVQVRLDPAGERLVMDPI
jgi:septum site-determining protein MinC